MNDLVRVATQQELRGCLQASQRERKLYIGHVLDLIDHDVSYSGLASARHSWATQAQVEHVRFAQPPAVARE